MTDAKDEDGVLSYPTNEEFHGIPNWETHDAALRKAHYKPLVGEAEPREGYTAEPGRWHTVEQSESRMEPRREDPVTKEPFIEDILEPDPETGEMKKVGERQVTRVVPVVYDTSYIQVDAWRYVPIPVPEPVLPRRFSKGELLEALHACNLYDQAKAIYVNDLDLQIAWGGFADIDMDYPATIDIMLKYPELFTPANVEMLQRYIAFGTEPQNASIDEMHEI